MKSSKICVMVGWLTGVSLGGVAIAQNTAEVTVRASRITTAKVDQTRFGVPIVEMTLSYRVDYRDLDLATSAGASKLEERVRKAAMNACKEIDSQYPTARPSNEACAKMAVDESMVTVRAAIAAAGKKAAK
jgi:UrcA family protein